MRLPRIGERLFYGLLMKQLSKAMRGILGSSIAVKDEASVWTVQLPCGLKRRSNQFYETPYGYVLVDEEIVIYEERPDVVRSIFEYYLAGASLGKIVGMLFKKGMQSPTGNPKWIRAAVDKLLTNKKYVPIVGMEMYLDTQFEKNRRCNVDYDRAGHPRKPVRYRSPSLERK